VRSFRRVCVFCGSSDSISEAYREAARSVGTLLASRDITLVYGGGRVGMMGEVADAVLAAGGQVMGVIPDKLQALELGHPGCTELFVVDSMHARKMMMAQLSDAFIALPGGWGTMEEIFEVTTWTQLNFHRKPVGLLNVDGYYDLLLAWVRHAHEQGFIRDKHATLLHSDADPAALLDALATAELPTLTKWTERA
jgi:uncharacterized protein (TIGR00730 family)